MLGGAGCGQGAVSPAAGPPPPPAAVVRFESAADPAGLRFRWPPLRPPLTILQAFGCGCAFLDYDRDGWQDLLLVAEPHPVLYRNLRDGTFAEVTERTGLQRARGAWKGCAVGDWDGDGWPDLLLNGYRSLALLRSREGAGWQDVTAAAGLRRDNRGRWGSGGGFMDLDGDGDLDLVLLNYVSFGPSERRLCQFPPGVPSGCPPRLYHPEFPELWENRGGKRLVEVTAAGMRDTTGTAQVLAFADVDEDGRMDFYLGNDGTPADLMRGLGGLRFENIGVAAGVAYGSEGTAIAAMGADWADYDGDGLLDLAVTAFSDEPYSLLRSLGAGRFEHRGVETGLAGLTRKPLGFGANFLDMDNDGWPDLAFANGHVHAAAARADPLLSFRQPVMLLHNRQGRTFHDLAPGMPGGVDRPLLGRGSASGDYDNDGRMDWLAVDYGGSPLLLRNVSEGAGHWLKVELSSGSANRLAYGARLEARAGGRSWTAQVSPASSYLSSSDPRVHFGLGAARRLDSLTIRWPSGRMETLRDLEVDRILKHSEGAAPGGQSR